MLFIFLIPLNLQGNYKEHGSCSTEERGIGMKSFTFNQSRVATRLVALTTMTLPGTSTGGDDDDMKYDDNIK